MSLKLENIGSLSRQSAEELRATWKAVYGRPAPAKIRRDFLLRVLAYRIQEREHGGLSSATRQRLKQISARMARGKAPGDGEVRIKPGTMLIREWKGVRHEVLVRDRDYFHSGTGYRSLTEIANRITGTHRSGPAFFGLRSPATKSVEASGG